MRRRIATVALIASLTEFGVAVPQGYTLSGRLGFTDQEAQEGDFAIDAQTIVVQPGSALQGLTNKVGQRARLTFEPDTESE
jgi:hypothetical protein